MGYSFLLAARLRKKKKKKVSSKVVEFQRIRRRRTSKRRVLVKSDTKLSGIEKLSDDLLMSILAKLPADVATRSMTVSKQWYSLIYSPLYRKLLIASSSAQPLSFVVSLMDSATHKHTFVSSYDDDDDDDDQSDTSVVSVFDQVWTLPGMDGYFISDLHGLLCLRHNRRIRICNLTTDQRVTLPIIRSRILVEPHDDIWTVFGYDHVHDEYKFLNIVSVVCKEEGTLRSEPRVLVLGAGAFWRNSNTQSHIYPHHPYTQGIIIEGVVYYGALLDGNKCAVMSFDFTSEDFKLIDLPIEIETIWHNSCSNITNYKNQIAVIEYSNLMIDASIDLWILEDAKKMKWSKETLILPISDMSLNGEEELLMKGTGRYSEVFLANMDCLALESTPYVFFDLEKKKITRNIDIRLPNPFEWFRKIKGRIQTAFWEHGIQNTMYLEV